MGIGLSIGVVSDFAILVCNNTLDLIGFDVYRRFLPQHRLAVFRPSIAKRRHPQPLELRQRATCGHEQICCMRLQQNVAFAAICMWGYGGYGRLHFMLPDIAYPSPSACLTSTQAVSYACTACPKVRITHWRSSFDQSVIEVCRG